MSHDRWGARPGAKPVSVYQRACRPFAAALLVAACGGQTQASSAGPGGPGDPGRGSGVGGSASGGVPASGGDTGSGGTAASGGDAGSGGTAASGGDAGSGGTAASGGSPAEISASAGTSGASACRRAVLAWTPPACKVGRIECDVATTFSVVEQRGESWVLLSPPPSGFADLHVFERGQAAEYALPVPPPGKLIRSVDPLPAVLDVQSVDDGTSFTLYRGLPDQVTSASLTSPTPVALAIDRAGVFWATASAEQVLVNQAPSLSDLPVIARYPNPGGLGPVVETDDQPLAVAGDGVEWYAFDLQSRSPTGIDGRYLGTAWLFFGGRALLALEGEPPAVTITDTPRMVAVLGTDAQHRAQQFVSVYGLSAADAQQRAMDTPAAPEILLTEWFRRTYDVPQGCTPTNGTPAINERVTSHRDEALARLGHDSAGNPWLVAVVIGTERTDVRSTRYQGEICIADSNMDAQVRVTLHLVRLTTPEVRKSFELYPGLTSAGSIDLDVMGPRGTLARRLSAEGASSVDVWQIDLDAV